MRNTQIPISLIGLDRGQLLCLTLTNSADFGAKYMTIMYSYIQMQIPGKLLNRQES
jgi:hypothetical protein